VTPKENQDKYQKRAAALWMDLYGHLEVGARALITNDLGLDSAAEVGEIVQKLVARLGQSPKDASNLIRVLGQYYDQINGRELGRFATEVRKNVEIVTVPRNHIAHRNTGRWLRSISIGGKSWEVQFDAFEKLSDAMCNMIVAISNEISTRGL
jgi:hypothetical protein